jgi:hypothetical protein
VSEEDKREKIRGKKEKITQRHRVNRDSQRMGGREKTGSDDSGEAGRGAYFPLAYRAESVYFALGNRGELPTT